VKRLPLTTLVLLVATFCPLVHGDQTDADVLDKIVTQHADAYVTIKFVLKMTSPNGGDQNQEQEIPGILINAKGLVLCSNAQMGGLAKRFGRQASPTDIKVLIGEDTQGLDAKVLTRDSELDLAWVQLDVQPEKPLPFLDFSVNATPTRGQTLISLRKLDKYFDRAVVLQKGYLAGETHKPRRLLIASSNLVPSLQALCQPIYTIDGKVIGVTVLQLPESPQPDLNPADMQGLILPSQDIVKATERALEAVANEGDLEE